MTKLPRSVFTTVTILVIYFLLLAYYGYRVGDEDLCETSAYAMLLKDPGLFSGDFYLTQLSESFINERYPFALLLSCIDPTSEWSYFVLHALCSCLLIWGLLQLSSLYLKKIFWQVAFVATALFFSYGMTLGGNEIWYNYVMPSLPAKAIGIWTLYFYLARKRWLAYGILIPAALLQPIVGAQLALIYLSLDGLSWIGVKRFPSSRQVCPPLLFGCTAGLWTLLIFFQQHDQQLVLDAQHFFEILETRLAHHFFPNYYPLTSWLSFGGIFLAGTSLWRRHSTTVFRLCMITAFGWCIYAIAVLWADSSFIASLQWFKTTIWIKVLCLLSITIWLEDRMKWKYGALPFALLLAALATFLVFRPSQQTRHFPWSDYTSAEIDIAELAAAHSDAGSSFILPPDMTALRFFGRRGVFIDYKSNLHTHGYLAEAERRRRIVYGLSLELRRSGKNVMHGMKHHYLSLTAEQVKSFKTEGATHIITSIGHSLALEKVAANAKYTVYRL